MQSLGTGMPQLSLDLGLETERSVWVFSAQACTILLAVSGYTAVEMGSGSEGTSLKGKLRERELREEGRSNSNSSL